MLENLPSHFGVEFRCKVFCLIWLLLDAEQKHVCSLEDFFPLSVDSPPYMYMTDEGSPG